MLATGRKDHGQMRTKHPRAARELFAGKTGQVDIGHEKIYVIHFKDGERGGCIAGFNHGVPEFTQQLARRRPNQFVILYKENAEWRAFFRDTIRAFVGAD